MADEKEKTVQKSYRLPVGDAEFIDLLAKRQVLGTNNCTAVLRALIRMARDEMTKSDYVKKHLEEMELLRKP
jgi:hypothetical protein